MFLPIRGDIIQDSAPKSRVTIQVINITQSKWHTLTEFRMAQNTNIIRIDTLYVQLCVLILTHILTYLTGNVYAVVAKIIHHFISLKKRQAYLYLFHTSSIMFIKKNPGAVHMVYIN